MCEYAIGDLKRTAELTIKKDGDKLAGTMSWPDQKDVKLKDVEPGRFDCGGFEMSLPAQRVVPALRITDYERSKSYYIEKLGFVVDWEHRFSPQLPVFMSIVRDGMQIYLTQHSGDCQVGGLVHFVIPDVDTCHLEFQKRGAQVAEAPNDDLGFRNMTILDPDGNQLRFMEPSSK